MFVSFNCCTSDVISGEVGIFPSRTHRHYQWFSGDLVVLSFPCSLSFCRFSFGNCIVFPSDLKFHQVWEKKNSNSSFVARTNAVLSVIQIPLQLKLFRPGYHLSFSYLSMRFVIKEITTIKKHLTPKYRLCVIFMCSFINFEVTVFAKRSE